MKLVEASEQSQEKTLTKIEQLVHVLHDKFSLDFGANAKRRQEITGELQTLELTSEQLKGALYVLSTLKSEIAQPEDKQEEQLNAETPIA